MYIGSSAKQSLYKFNRLSHYVYLWNSSLPFLIKLLQVALFALINSSNSLTLLSRLFVKQDVGTYSVICFDIVTNFIHYNWKDYKYFRQNFLYIFEIFFFCIFKLVLWQCSIIGFGFPFYHL